MAYTYAEMKTAIQNFAQNSETTFVANLDNFIIAAENKIFGTVDLPSRWKSETDEALVSGTAEYTLTDSGIMEILSVRIAEGGSSQGTDVEFGPVRYLLVKDYDFLLEAYPGSSTASTKGIPKYYAISTTALPAAGTSQPDMTIRLGPIPDAAAYSMTVTYYANIIGDSLTQAGVDNYTWLSSQFPQVLLYGSLIEAYIYMKGEQDVIAMYEKQFLDGMVMMKNFIESRMLGSDNYRPDVSVPAGR